MSAPATTVDLGTWPEVGEFIRLLTSTEKERRRLAKRFGDDTLITRINWRNATFQFSLSKDDRPVAKRAKKSSDDSRVLSNYNVFLRTKGLFERLCEDLNVPEGERSIRTRLAAIEGANETSPWISVAREIWKRLTVEQKAAIYEAGEGGALAVLVDTEQYRAYVDEHALGAGDDHGDKARSGGESSS